ncbi:Uncharacterized protein APZ42_031233 [Daphnia magna]|uniref:Uncharacterized protein n=1 Tax=Daphnia magna TaxID=35525 RepID=A0A164N0U1_9CRUS|nr:Uncharacterized protein APZ42_031233 [Daphnia magna]
MSWSMSATISEQSNPSLRRRIATATCISNPVLKWTISVNVSPIPFISFNSAITYCMDVGLDFAYAREAKHCSRPCLEIRVICNGTKSLDVCEPQVSIGFLL